MTDKELSKLKRSELLKLMIEQGEVLAQTQSQLEEVQRQLADRHLEVEQAGNLADASVSVNRLLESAQSTAEQYIDNVRQYCDQQEKALKLHVEETDAECERRLTQAQVEAQETLTSARKEAEQILETARLEAEQIKAQAQPVAEIQIESLLDDEPQDASVDAIRRQGIFSRKRG